MTNEQLENAEHQARMVFANTLDIEEVPDTRFRSIARKFLIRISDTLNENSRKYQSGSR